MPYYLKKFNYDELYTFINDSFSAFSSKHTRNKELILKALSYIKDKSHIFVELKISYFVLDITLIEIKDKQHKRYSVGKTYQLLSQEDHDEAIKI